MADDKTYSYMYNPKDVPSSGNKYQVGDTSGPLPYAPPGVVQFGTYPEPPEGYKQYQVADGEKITSYDVGTGKYPNVGPGMVPRGYDVPPPPPLRTPERTMRPPTPAPPSMQSAGYSRDYDRYVGHLDPKYSGAFLATPQEKFVAGAHTGATQTAIQDQFEKNRMQQGGEQYNTLESYAMDKFNSIPKMDLTAFQDMMENDFGIHDPIRASMATPLAPSVQAMQERYDASLPPQPKHSLTAARQAANLQAAGGAGYTPGAYPTPPTPASPQPVSSPQPARYIETDPSDLGYSKKEDSMDPRDSASSLYAYSKPKSPIQPVPSISTQPVASTQPVQSLPHDAGSYNKYQSTPRPFESKFSAEEMKIAASEIANRERHIRDVPDMVQPPDFSPKTQEIADYLKTTSQTLEEGGNINSSDSDAGTNTFAGTLASVVGHLGNIAANYSSMGLASKALGLQPASLQAAIDKAIALGKKDYVAPAGPDVGTVGLSVDPSDASEGISGEPGGQKDGGEIRKYQDGTTDVGSLEPRIEPSRGVSLPGMEVINDPKAGPPSDLDDKVPAIAKEGDVVFPPESVEIMGLLNMNDMIKAALGLALEVGAVVPPDIDPNEKVPVRLTNGEVIIPKVVADAVGKERVEEIINKGLKLRAQREEQAQAQQQAAPQAAPPMPQGLKEGSSGIGKQMDSLLQGAESIYKDVKKNPSKWGTAALTEIGDALGLSQDHDLDTRAREAWSSYHGAEPDLLKEAQFVLHQTGKDDPELRKVIQGTLKNYYDEKDGQIIGDKGLNPTTVEEIMMRIAAHETPGGETRQMIKEKGKLVPKGRARGRLQVEPTTARSMLVEAGGPEGIIGPKVRNSLTEIFGVNKYEDIQALSNKEFNNVLQNNPRASVEFGILNLITKLKRDKKLDLIR